MSKFSDANKQVIKIASAGVSVNRDDYSSVVLSESVRIKKAWKSFCIVITKEW